MNPSPRDAPPAYRIVETDLARGAEPLRLDAHENGAALLVREGGRPLGFGMRELAPHATLSALEIAAWAAALVDRREPVHGPLARPVARSGAGSLPPLTIAVCTHDRPESLHRCLRSLLELAAPGVEIVVVDNAPSDERTRTLLASLPDVRYVREPRPGLDFARNRALAVASGGLIAYLDDDVSVDGRWLDGLRGAYLDNPDAGAFTGLVLPLELETPAQVLFERRGGFRRGFRRIRYGASLPGNPLYPCGAGIFGAGCNMVFDRALLMTLGGFDEALDTGAPLPGGGDLDIFYRVVRAGRPLVYEPDMLVFHQHRREMHELRRQYWSWGLGFLAFVAKSFRHDAPMRPRLLRLVSWWFGHQMRLLRDSCTGAHPLPAGMILAELRGGLRGMFGGYARSRRRVAAIRERFAALDDGAVGGP